MSCCCDTITLRILIQPYRASAFCCGRVDGMGRIWRSWKPPASESGPWPSLCTEETSEDFGIQTGEGFCLLPTSKPASGCSADEYLGTGESITVEDLQSAAVEAEAEPGSPTVHELCTNLPEAEWYTLLTESDHGLVCDAGLSLGPKGPEWTGIIGGYVDCWKAGLRIERIGARVPLVLYLRFQQYDAEGEPTGEPEEQEVPLPPDEMEMDEILLECTDAGETKRLEALWVTFPGSLAGIGE